VVLAATDFSEHADKAVHRAARLAAEHSARLVLLHVIEPSAWRRWFATAPDCTSTAAQRLDELARDIRRRTRIEVIARLEHGTPVDTIARAARQADLLVLGATSGGSLRERVLGTTAHRLLLRCERPLLVVRRAARRAYANALVPLDFSAASAQALQLALDLAAQANVHALHAFGTCPEGKLRLVGVTESAIRRQRDVARRTAQAGADELLASLSAVHRRRVRFEAAAGEPSPLAALVERRIGADLVVMCKRGRSRIEDLCLGSLTRHMMDRSQADVLVLPYEAAQSCASSLSPTAVMRGPSIARTLSVAGPRRSESPTTGGRFSDVSIQPARLSWARSTSGKP
jgi:nucleotide-binding universal stress UspA family protein